ncbi:uncharacterized protein EI90DRAFT_3019698 [Cantharellus anzutake]|uniref:uncharacterized protein n=1 Tax=Cantharellus anzutake TaxID=1750568 RepID=UPI0019056C84|nr:uncharacterized protein EI90DRAFT_3019698 [Cantharellus anzutake]KAF8324357.1 hypothetical protein EI90DRAFT_3019698 [Cantharellus anzutake]
MDEHLMLSHPSNSARYSLDYAISTEEMSRMRARWEKISPSLQRLSSRWTIGSSSQPTTLTISEAHSSRIVLELHRTTTPEDMDHAPMDLQANVGSPDLEDRESGDQPISDPEDVPSTCPASPANYDFRSHFGTKQRTRSGRQRQVVGEEDIFGGCCCGESPSENEIAAGQTVKCAHIGCEYGWFHLECVDLCRAEENWKCPDHQPKKQHRAQK